MVDRGASRSIDGPWENAPDNSDHPHASADEPWWSRGHATLIEGPDARWYMVHHGYEKGYMTLEGRRCWSRSSGPRMDGFARQVATWANRFACRSRQGRCTEWPVRKLHAARFDLVVALLPAGQRERDRVSLDDGVLTLTAKGASPKDSVPLFLTAGDHAYEVEVVMEFDAGAQAGVLLFYSKALYVGLGFNDHGTVMHRYGQERNGARLANLPGRRVHVRMVNRHHIVTFFTSADGKAWTKYGVQMEVSGYHQNVGGDFQALRPALYAAGKGAVRFSDFRYRALP